jgi:hypothetical protein
MAYADLRDDRTYTGTFCCNGCSDMKRHARPAHTIYDPVHHHRFCGTCDPRINDAVRARVYPQHKYMGPLGRMLAELEAARIHLSHAASIARAHMIKTTADAEALTREYAYLLDANRTFRAEIENVSPGLLKDH